MPRPSRGREYRLAINLFDLDRLTEEQRLALIRGKVDLKNWIRPDPNIGDEVAVVFTCPLIQAAVTCDVIRSGDRKLGDSPTRVYIEREKWTKLPGDAILTEALDGGAVLHREIFDARREIVTEAPPLRRRVT